MTALWSELQRRHQSWWRGVQRRNAWKWLRAAERSGDLTPFAQALRERLETFTNMPDVTEIDGRRFPYPLLLDGPTVLCVECGRSSSLADWDWVDHDFCVGRYEQWEWIDEARQAHRDSARADARRAAAERGWRAYVAANGPPDVLTEADLLRHKSEDD